MPLRRPSRAARCEFGLLRLQFGSKNLVIHFARPFPTAPAVSRAVRDQWLVHGRCADENQRFTSRDHNGCDKNQYSVTGHIRLLVVGQ